MNDLIWTDIETTGLDPARDQILEVGLLATDWEGHKLNHGVRCTLRWSRPGNLHMSGFARAMHSSNHLIDELPTGTPRYDVSDLLCQYASRYPKALMAGSSVHFDHSFLSRDFPKLVGMFPHRLMDVSVLDELAEHAAPDVFAARPPKTTDHRVTHCLHDSVLLYRYYLSHLDWRM